MDQELINEARRRASEAKANNPAPVQGVSSPSSLSMLEEAKKRSQAIKDKQAWDAKSPLEKAYGYGKDIVSGAAKGLGSTLWGTAKLAQDYIANPAGRLVGLPDVSIVSPEKPKELEAVTPMEQLGYGIEQIGEFFVPATKVAKLEKGMNIAQKAATEALVTGAQTSMQQGKVSPEGFAFGAATPFAGAAVKGAYKFTKPKVDAFREGTAARLVNSVIKPLKKDFAYGKNPGLGIAREGITGNNLDDIAQKAGEAKNKVGQQISSLIGGIPKEKATFSAQGMLKPLEDAMDSAAKQNNTALYNRLQNVKYALTNDLVRASSLGEETLTSAAFGFSPEEAAKLVAQDSIISKGARNLNDLSAEDLFNLKKEIGDITQWTGNPSDDKLVNSALKRAYTTVRNDLETGIAKVDPLAAKDLKKMNEHYGNLTSAEIAAKYRDKIESRQNLISLTSTNVGIGGALLTALATGGSTVPALLAGVGAAQLNAALKSPGVMTRLAAWMGKAAPAEKEALYKKIPALRDTVKRVFGSDLKEVKDMPMGLSIEDVSGTPAAGKNLQKAPSSSPGILPTPFLNQDNLKKKDLTNPSKYFQILPKSYLKTPKQVFRGVSFTGEGIGASGGGAAVEGFGLYTTTKKNVAKGYATLGGRDGKILELDPKSSIPSNPIYFRSSDSLRDWITLVSKEIGINPRDFERTIGINRLVNLLGHDGVAFDMNGGVTYVKYPRTSKDMPMGLSIKDVSPSPSGYSTFFHGSRDPNVKFRNLTPSIPPVGKTEGVNLQPSISLTPPESKGLAEAYGSDDMGKLVNLQRGRLNLKILEEGTPDAIEYDRINREAFKGNEQYKEWGTSKEAYNFLESRGYDGVKVTLNKDSKGMIPAGEDPISEIRVFKPIMELMKKSASVQKAPSSSPAVMPVPFINKDNK